MIYLINLILNNLTSSIIDLDKLVIIVIIYISIIIIKEINSAIENILKNIINRKTNLFYDLNINEKLIKIPMSIIDSSEGKDLIDNVKYIKHSVCEFPLQLLQLINWIYVFSISYFIIIKYNVWFSVIFLILSIPGIIINYINNKDYDNLHYENTSSIRKFSYYRWMLTDPLPAKDIRLYDLTDPLKKRYREEANKYLIKKQKLDKKTLINETLFEFLKLTGLIFFTLVVIYDAINNNIMIGEVALYIGLATTIMNSFENSFFLIVNVFTNHVERMNWLFKFENISYSNSTGYKKLLKFEVLEFVNVKFKYPFNNNYILNGTSFTINMGDKLLIIGKNGSGKTTIIKLLLGLYQPESGHILINGYPLCEYDKGDLQKLYSVLFQSYVSYPLTLRENVGLSDISKINQDSEIKIALKKSGIFQNPDELNNGLDTYLSRQFDDQGIELSKGQWQKLALSRTYFKNSSIIIFDEPSSSLDPEAESKIFSNFYRLAKGKTGIMISHRILGANMVNKIIVLNDGIITETGSHEELVSKSGLYAELYNIQKKNYIKNEAE